MVALWFLVQRGVQYTGASSRGKLLILLLSLAVSGCATFGYYSQAVRGQLQVMAARQPVSRLLAAEDTPAALRRQLQLSRRVLEYAQTEMALEVGKRYSLYADIGRDHVVYNVVAAPEFSLQPKSWCYPLVGCAPYRGFFSSDAAVRLANRLEAEGFEVSVSGASAYSTLGWFNDPLLNTFVGWNDGQLASLLLHELAHSRVWIRGDVRLNESFASFVGERGAQSWLAGEPQRLRAFLQDQTDRASFNRWAAALRKALLAVYSLDIPNVALRERKARVFEAFGACATVVGSGRYTQAIRTINNAKLALVSTYGSFERSFDRMFEAADGDWARFFEAVDGLRELSVDARREHLRSLASADEDITAGAYDHHTGQVQCEAFASHPVDGEPAG